MAKLLQSWLKLTKLMSVLGSPIAPATLAMTPSIESTPMFGAFEAVVLRQLSTKFVSILSPGRRRQQRLQNAYKQLTAQLQFSSSDHLGIRRILNHQVVWAFVMYISSLHTNMLKDWIWEAATASNIVFRLRFPFVGPRSAVCRVTLTRKRASSLPGVCKWRVNLQSGLKDSRRFPIQQIVLHFCQFILSWMTTNY